MEPVHVGKNSNQAGVDEEAVEEPCDIIIILNIGCMLLCYFYR